MKIELGNKVHDEITGLTGIAISRCEYLYDAPSVQVQPESLDKDGNPAQAHWIHEARLRPVGA